MLYIFHGEEEFTRSEAVAKLKQRIASDGTGDLNIVTLEGERLLLEELIEACNALPFFGERRLVIVEGLLQTLEPRRGRGRRGKQKEVTPSVSQKEYAQKLADYLPALPETTRLLFVERQTLSASNPVLKTVQKLGGYIREFKVPEGSELQRWVRRRAQAKGVSISREAAALLTLLVGANLRQLDRELEKLAALVNYAREITPEDVRVLVSAAQEANIFGLVDALGMRQARQAMAQLERLLADGANELYLLAMIARQVRLLIGIKDLYEERRLPPAEVRRQLGIGQRFVFEKLVRQARRFRLAELKELLQRVLTADQAIKTGQMPGPLALELLVLEICRRRSPAQITRGAE
ncbi:MAG: DNA polymerase III subunit delta [Anaerolineae bacterium]|nr:DNA polymerase III subunit delta [Anaerolineae bacterium]